MKHPKHIKTPQAAHKWLEELNKNRLLWHPEEDPEDTVWITGLEPTRSEIKQMGDLMAQCHKVTDPCTFVTLPYWQRQIVLVGNIPLPDARMAEELIRDQHPTLNGLSQGQFKKAAIQAGQIVAWTKTPEGKAYLAELDREILN